MIGGILWILLGLVFLVIGGEWLVRGASKLAARMGVSPLMIGLTVVAFGTSSPELAVSIKASFSGQGEIAVGNVVGSNSFNVLFILGLAALIAPLAVASQLVRIDVPLMVLASVVAFLLALDGGFGRLDGLLLFLGLLAYIGWSIYQARREPPAVVEEFAEAFPPVKMKPPRIQLVLQVVLIIAGLVMLTLGARWFVNGAVSLARDWGISELVIGLTIVAAGTSLPEVATSILASVRGERDIAVGNVVGSNLFNICCVLGLTSLISPEAIPVSDVALRRDLPVMIAVAVACWPIFITGHRIARWEGAVFFGYYIAYVTFLVLEATRSELTSTVGSVLVLFVIPLTVLTMVVSLIRWLRRKSESHDA